MGRELLSLNLSFATLLAQPPEAMPGEARQSFRALGALPPLRYRAPDAEDQAADPRCTPREDISHEQLLQMPLLHNPILDATPAEHRATPAEEREMLRWAKHGVTRVAHVLNETSTRVLKFEELCTHHPNLVGRGATRDCVKRMFERISAGGSTPYPTAHGPGCSEASSGTHGPATSYVPGRRPMQVTLRCRPGSARQSRRRALYVSQKSRPRSRRALPDNLPRVLRR